MNLGATLALSLLLFAPGLAAYLRLFHVFRAPGPYPAPPPPGSLLALAVVTLSALVAHALAAFALHLNQLVIDLGLHLWRTRSDPNLYAAILGERTMRPALSPSQSLWLLAGSALLSLAAFHLMGAVVRGGLARGWLQGPLYGWTAPIFRAATAGQQYVTAFVLTGVTEDGAYVGYEGTVDNLSLDANKEILSVTLTDCSRFVLNVGWGTANRRPTDPTDRIPRLYVPASDIRNVAFETVRVETASR
jgi:hypothetical protein